MDELLALRLGLIAVIFVFLAAVAWTMLTIELVTTVGSALLLSYLILYARW